MFTNEFEKIAINMGSIQKAMSRRVAASRGMTAPQAHRKLMQTNKEMTGMSMKDYAGMKRMKPAPGSMEHNALRSSAREVNVLNPKAGHTTKSWDKHTAKKWPDGLTPDVRSKAIKTKRNLANKVTGLPPSREV